MLTFYIDSSPLNQPKLIVAYLFQMKLKHGLWTLFSVSCVVLYVAFHHVV